MAFVNTALRSLSGSQQYGNIVLPIAVPSSEDVHLHATLERIDQIANEDVIMQPLLLAEQTFVVLDTNILLHHFEVLQHFVAEFEALSLPVVVVIPGVVINELDGQKNRDGLAWFARRASAWLLKKVKERKSVKGQAREETCKISKNWKVQDEEEEFGYDRANDYLILDCARFYQRAGFRVVLCSADRNLCFNCEAQYIPTISPSARWSSRELAQAIFGIEVDLDSFTNFRVSYRGPKSKAPAAKLDDDGGMDVDDDETSLPDLLPSHALDLLHLQVIEHFMALLIELVGRVAGPEILRVPAGEGSRSSRYAPDWAKKHYLEWTAPDCLEYLGTKKRLSPSSPRLDLFLTYPYGGSGSGARRGQEWSRRDWDVALGVLRSLGDAWQEPSIGESLDVLQPHLTAIFEGPMRPSGIGNSFG